MITKLGVASVYVPDADEAKAWFVEKLGFEERFDLRMDNGFRWITVGPPADPMFQLNLAVPGPPMHDEETAAAIRDLVTKGGGNGVIFTVDDCRKTYEQLLEKGIEFTQEPTEHFYGIDCGLRDPFGNPLRITQPAPQPLKIPTPEEFAADTN